ncbi:MAG: response regulator, partial [Cytophagaceae bacterium]|nr:response regulator [Gemmatimonadaceae bacterium]
VFDLFTQVDRNAGRAQGGLGIGLTLVKSLVGMHGGRVAARSDGTGCGSEFEVRVPLAMARVDAGPSADRAQTPGTLQQRRVLVVDDNQDAAESLGALLSLLGAETRIAFNGPEALEALPEFRPEVVLLDIGMPGMDGHEVARRIHQHPGFADLPLVALTGWGQQQDREKSHGAGFNHHLVKPADLDALRSVLGSIGARSTNH